MQTLEQTRTQAIVDLVLDISDARMNDNEEWEAETYDKLEALGVTHQVADVLLAALMLTSPY